jgi:hypothetical protein
LAIVVARVDPVFAFCGCELAFHETRQSVKVCSVALSPHMIAVVLLESGRRVRLLYDCLHLPIREAAMAYVSGCGTGIVRREGMYPW